MGDRIHLLIVGGGQGGRAMLDIFSRTADVHIAGIVDTRPDAPALAFARDKGIRTEASWAPFFGTIPIDIIIDVTGVEGVHAQLQREKPEACDLIAGNMARVLWSLVEKYQGERGTRRVVEGRLQLLAHAIEQGPAIVVVTDPTGTIEYVNRKFVEVTGYTAEEAVGQNPRILKSGELPPEEYHLLWETINAGREWRGEFHNKRKDGTLYWESALISPVKGQSGRIEHFIAIKEDSTEARRLEDDLKRFRAALDGSADSLFLIDRKTMRFVDMNATACVSTGYSHDELLRMGPQDIKPLLTREELEAEFDRVITSSSREDGQRHMIETVHRRKDGTIFPVEIILSSFQTAAGALIIASVRDVSVQESARAELAQSQALLAQTGRMAHIGGWAFDVDTREQVWTDETYRLHEVGPDFNPTVDDGLSFFPEEARPLIEAALTAAIDEGLPYDLKLPFVTAAGNHRWVRAMGQADRRDGRTVRVWGAIQDITDQKQIEDFLADQLLFIRTMLDAVPLPVFYKDTEYRYVGCNRKFEEFFGRSRDEIVGKTVYDIAPKEEADRYHVMDEALFADPGVQEYEFRVVGDGGSVRDVLFHKSTFADAQGHIAGIIGAITDITERKRWELEMRRLSAIVASSSDAIIGKTLDGTITSWNKGAERIYGYSAEEVLGRSISILLPEGREDELQGLLGKLRQGRAIDHFITERRRKDGVVITVSLTFSAIRDERGAIVGVSAIGRDVTKEHRAEEELKNKMTYIERLNQFMVGREQRIIQLKDEINRLLEDQGKPRRFTV